MMGKMKHKYALPVPNEIQENILSRVPVKTIMRFMSVCKSWYSLFLNPYFINIQSINNINDSNNLLLMRLFKGRSPVPSLIVTDTSLLFILDPQMDQIKIVGSCDGIVCVEGLQDRCSDGVFSKYIYLWNQALRVVKNIKKNEWHIGLEYLVSERIVLGFGFDSHSIDHKVIRFQTSDVTLVKQVEIYSVALDSWRTVKASSPHNIMEGLAGYGVCSSGVYVNGVHHWPVYFHTKYAHEEYTYFVAIISFGLGKEVFKETMMSTKCIKRDFMSTLNYRTQLFNYNESLAMLIFNEDNLNYNIWVMNDNDTLPESWTKLCKVDTLRVGCRYFHGFIQMKNEVIFSRITGHGQESRIVFDMYKSEVNHSSSTANIYFLEDATEIMSFKESLVLLDSNN